MDSTQVKVSFENLAPADGAGVSPFWVGFHDGSFDLFDANTEASSAIRLVAEDGITGLETQIPGFIEFALSQNIDLSELPDPSTTVAGLFSESAGANGGTQDLAGLFRPDDPVLLGQGPGEEASVILDLENSEDNRFFSFLSMMFPTNDGFIANEDPLSIEVFDEDGNFVGADLVISGDEVWDAGTEVNDESPENIPFTPEGVGVGTPENGVIEPFPVPGFQPVGSGGALDVVDQVGDNVRLFSNADFTQPGVDVARLTISEVEPDEQPDSMPEPTVITVTVENVAPEQGIGASPFWFGVHDGSFDLFDEGTPASPQLALVAEEGVTGLELTVPELVSLALAEGFDPSQLPAPEETLSGLFTASDTGGNGGTQALVTTVNSESTFVTQSPGEIGTTTLEVNDPLRNRFLSFTSMLFPTNDGFVGNDDPQEIEIFDEEGNFIGADFLVTGGQVWDAGSEVNDEEFDSIPYEISSVGAGEPEDGTVQLFPTPGFLPAGEGGFLDIVQTVDGVTRDAGNADFTSDPDAPIFQITVTEAATESPTEESPTSPIGTPIVASISADPTTVIPEGESFAFVFDLSAPAPTGGLQINLTGEGSDGVPGDDDEPNLALSENIAGLRALVGENGEPLFVLTIAEGASEARLVVDVTIDDIVEGIEDSSVTLLEGEGYAINPTQSTATIQRIDLPEATPEPQPAAPIFTGAENDSLSASNGSDEFTGDRGLMFMGAGQDVVDVSQATIGHNRIFGGSDADELIAGIGDRLYGGQGDDLLDASAGRGDNHLAGQGGNDFLLAGSGDYLTGGEGDDSLFITGGGDNLLTGGPGADAFWIASGELPAALNTITDFEVGTDVMGIGGLSLGFTDLNITQQSADTLIGTGNRDLAVLTGVNAQTITPDQFAFA